MKIGTIIQARMGSSRLPGKVLKPLPYRGGKTALEHVILRARQVQKMDEVIVATTTSPADEEIVHVAKRIGVPVFQGSENNVLERFYLTAKSHKLDFIVRITSDCPVVDPMVINQLLTLHFDENADFTSSGMVRSFPIGQDASIFNFEMLEQAYKSASKEHEKEHVTTYFYKTHPDRYKISVLTAPQKWTDPRLRLTLDTPEDYVMLCCLFEGLYQKNKLFGLDSILDLVAERPYLREINASVYQKKVAITLREQIAAILPAVRAQGFDQLEKLLLSTKLGK